MRTRGDNNDNICAYGILAVVIIIIIIIVVTTNTSTTNTTTTTTTTTIDTTKIVINQRTILYNVNLDPSNDNKVINTFTEYSCDFRVFYKIVWIAYTGVLSAY